MKISIPFFFLSLSLATHAASYYTPDSIPPPPLPAKAKNEAIAYGLAIGSTLFPDWIGIAILKSSDATPRQTIEYTFLFSGLIVGPSTGQIYANSYKEGLLGISARGLGISLIVYSIANNAQFDYVSGNHNGYGALEFSGVIICTAGILYSLIDTHFAVHRYNNPGEPKLQKFGVMPSWRIDGNGTPQAGLVAWARF